MRRLFANCSDVNRLALLRDVVKHAKVTDPQFPQRGVECKRGFRHLQDLAVPRWGCGFVVQLLVDCLSNLPPIEDFDRLEFPSRLTA
jgi:hypothetical protein